MVANDERHETSERPEAEQLDEEDREDDFLEAARDREDRATEIVDRRRRDVFRSADADGDRKRDADDSGNHRHPETLGDALGDLVPAADEIRREEAEINAAPRGKPSQTRVQFTSVVPNTSAR